MFGDHGEVRRTLRAAALPEGHIIHVHRQIAAAAIVLALAAACPAAVSPALAAEATVTAVTQVSASLSLDGRARSERVRDHLGRRHRDHQRPGVHRHDRAVRHHPQLLDPGGGRHGHRDRGERHRRRDHHRLPAAGAARRPRGVHVLLPVVRHTRPGRVVGRLADPAELRPRAEQYRLRLLAAGRPLLTVCRRARSTASSHRSARPAPTWWWRAGTAPAARRTSSPPRSCKAPLRPG